MLEEELELEAKDRFYIIKLARLKHVNPLTFSLAMTQPNRQLIAQVMLYSQGFRSAELLSNKIVPLFK